MDVILKDIELSQEKFKRIVSLLRKLERIPGDFQGEWGFNTIKNRIRREPDFARLIGQLLVDGKRDIELQEYIPRYYLDMLNYREIQESSLVAKRIRYKSSLIGTYGGRKGYKVEGRIEQELEKIKAAHGVPFERGRSRIIDVDIDFAVPSVGDPWVIIMSSFQETTSSGQSTKVRDMFNAYQRLDGINSRHGENRVFVNFVDGGGWLARKRDMRRLVEQCHYCINLSYIDMLESIVLGHVPKKYFNPS